MNSSIYWRIKELCDRRGITITKLEKDCGFSNSTVKKWKSMSTPNADTILIVAKYLNVSTDYLFGNTDICTPIDEYIGNENYVKMQRKMSRMNSKDQERALQMIDLGFQTAYDDQDKNKSE